MFDSSARRWSNVASLPRTGPAPATDRNAAASLAGVVVGFDLDNTLIDPTGAAYQDTVHQWLASGPCELHLDEAFPEYENFRRLGDVIERLGFRNPIHERGNADGLAAFCLLCPAAAAVAHRLGAESCHAAARSLTQLAGLDLATRFGAPKERLAAEVAMRRSMHSDSHLRAFVAATMHLAKHPDIVAWGDRYDQLEETSRPDNAGSLVAEVCARGAVAVVITDGRRCIQQHKLERIGLASTFAGRLLVSEQAAKVEGHVEFRRTIDRELDNAPGAGHGPSRTLAELWPFECVRRDWLRKSPWFFGRCLHAVRRSSINPEAVLTEPGVVPRDQWRESPLRFVMVGDRHDTDVLPLRELLGSAAPMIIRWAGGKYGHVDANQNPTPAMRASRVFSNWSDLQRFFATELRRDDIAPITTAPRLLSDALASDVVATGSNSPLSFVRAVSRIAIAEML